jgi:pimeloyl-ACP methyl ester carboxylesterase
MVGVSAVYARSDGAGEPVVLLHAGGLDSRMFEGDMEALARLAHILRYDRCGGGRSPAAATPVDRVAELRDVVAATFGAVPVVLVGCSYGGQLAIDFALAHAPQIAGLLLVGPGMSGVEPSPELRARQARLRVAAVRGREALAHAWFDDPYHAPGRLPVATSNLVTRMLGDSIELFTGPSPSASAPSAVGRLRELRSPGIVFVGEHDDHDSRAIALKLSTESDALELRLVRGAGHYPSLERSGWLPAALHDVLVKIDHSA